MKTGNKGRPAGPPSASRSQAENRLDLTALFEFSSSINASLELKFILGHMLLTLMGKLLATRAVVFLRSGEREFRIETGKGIPPGDAGTSFTIGRPPRALTTPGELSAADPQWSAYLASAGIDLLLPLKNAGKIVGIAGFGLSPLKRQIGPAESTYLKSIGNIAASAIEKSLIIDALRDANRRLDRKIQEITTLFELGKEFNAILDRDRLVRTLLLSLMGQIGVRKYLLTLDEQGEMKPLASRIDGEPAAEFLSLLRGLKAPFLPRTTVKKSEQRLRTAMDAAGLRIAVPLFLQGALKGVIALGEKMGGDYAQADVEFLTSLGNLAMISIENARLFQEAIEKQKMEDELLIAKDIQRGLLPTSVPDIPGFVFSAVNISSKQVGGDYYDIVRLDDGTFMIAIGDVSGKGTPASLLMATLQATIRALIPLGLPLGELTGRVNDLTFANTGAERFITFFWGILDPRRRTFRYVNAGHNPPYVFHADGSHDRLDQGGLILGIMDTLVPYKEGEIALRHNDLLLMFTDGVSEAMNDRDEEWGEERLESIARNKFHSAPADIISAVVEDIRNHARGIPQSDDITLVLARALPAR